MTYAWSLAALWLGLALVATLFALWFRVSTALTEIIVGTLAQLILGSLFGSDVLGGNKSWAKFLAGAGAIVLTFLAGAELDPVVFRRNWKEATAVGLIGFRSRRCSGSRTASSIRRNTRSSSPASSPAR